MSDKPKVIFQGDSWRIVRMGSWEGSWCYEIRGPTDAMGQTTWQCRGMDEASFALLRIFQGVVEGRIKPVEDKDDGK
jgi:hypothetical protein